MKTFLFAIAFSSMAMAATTCPNFSGTWDMYCTTPGMKDLNAQLLIQQKGCEELAANNHQVGLTEPSISVQEGRNTSGLNVSRIGVFASHWEGDVLRVRSKTIDKAIGFPSATTVLSVNSQLSFNADGTLSYSWSSTGSAVETTCTGKKL